MLFMFMERLTAFFFMSTAFAFSGPMICGLPAVANLFLNGQTLNIASPLNQALPHKSSVGQRGQRSTLKVEII